MTLKPDIEITLLRYQANILQAMHQAIQQSSVNLLPTQEAELDTFYGQMRYHLGWVDSTFSPVTSHPGKLIRPALLLLAYEASGAWGMTSETTLPSSDDYLRRALPAAASVELTHNFTLIHDDIVDGDTERRHRATLWSIWGTSQGTNTGDGMFALGRLALWEIVREGVEGEIAVKVAATLDKASLIIAEGQYLDLSFEQRQDISVAMYVDMISRKTAALMGCAAEMGALLGTRETTVIESLRNFGFEIGIAFQVRDDMLGIWASATELGKTPAGDIYRRKKSLPILHAMEHASAAEQQRLRQLYELKTPLNAEQVAEVLTIFQRTRTQEHCLSFLGQRCERARQILGRVARVDNPVAVRAREDMETLVRFIETSVPLALCNHL
jgi:geranylgeranyl diphosphate synthase type I